MALVHLEVRKECLMGNNVQESTIGAAFLTKTLPEYKVKFEIW